MNNDNEKKPLGNLYRTQKQRNSPYIIMDKAILYDLDLPLECLGLLSKMMVYEDLERHWTIKELTDEYQFRRVNLRKLLRILEAHGYVENSGEQIAVEKGEFWKVIGGKNV